MHPHTQRPMAHSLLAMLHDAFGQRRAGMRAQLERPEGIGAGRSHGNVTP